MDALGRLNDLRRRHPDEPAVYRGYVVVYLEHYYCSDDALKCNVF